MTEPSAQQPGYPSAQQQQAAYAAQQQQAAAYAAQQQQAAYGHQPAAGANMLTKLPMSMLTFGLAGGGVAAVLIGLLVAGSKGNNPFAGGLLSIPAAIMVATGLAITTGPKLRNTYRAIALAFVIATFGTTIGALIGDGELSNADGAVVIGNLLFVAGLALFSAATFTMKEQPSYPAPPQATGMIPTVPPQATGQQYPGQQGWQQQQ